MTEEAAKLKQQFDAEKAAKMQALAKLEVELEAARAELKELDAKQADLEKAKVAGRGRHERDAGRTAAASEGTGGASARPSPKPARIATPISRRSSG